MSTRKEPSSFSVSSSWRMVDGDGNDSFDTSVVRDVYDDIDDDDFIHSSPPVSQNTNPTSSFNPTGPVSSFDASIGSASQDSISNYLNTADDEHLLRRTGAFRPSVPPAARKQPSSPLREPSFSSYDRDYRTPEPQLRFPKVEVESPRRGASSRTSSTKTIRPTTHMALTDAAEFRKRTKMGASSGSPLKLRRGSRQEGSDYYPQPLAVHGPSIRERLATSIPHGILDVLGWLLKVLGWAFNILAPIFAIALALYLLTTFGGLLWSYYQPAISSALSPVCKIPGASLLDIPFCQSGAEGKRMTPRRKREPIEFDDLISVQSQFGTVLEESSTSVSLPLEMKRSEASIRDLRTLVKTSKLEAKDSLALEFDGFVDATSKSADGLTHFTVEVGTAVDRILVINKHTMRYIHDLLPEETDASSSEGLLELVLRRIFGIQKHSRAWNEEKIRQKYIEHTNSLAERIESLLVQAQAVLRELNIAEGHLSVILEIVAKESGVVEEKKEELRPNLWTLWGLVGGSRSQVRSLQTQLNLLRTVDMQRNSAVDKVNRLVLELKEMQLKLADLRDRVMAPGLAEEANRERNLLTEIPLSVHIETINRGIERLEEARMRIRSEENERVHEVLQRGQPEEKLINDS